MTPKNQTIGIKVFAEDTSALERMDMVEGLLRTDTALESGAVELRLVGFLMKDTSAIVRHEAAFCLGRLHRTCKPLEAKSVEALCHAAQTDMSVVVRHEAAETLGYIHCLRVRKALKFLLDDPVADVVETARISLARHELDNV